MTREGVLSYSGVSRVFAIDPRWRDKFGPGVMENVEFEWRYHLPSATDVQLNQDEHSAFEWLPIADAIERSWSWTNRDALKGLLR